MPPDAAILITFFSVILSPAIEAGGAFVIALLSITFVIFLFKEMLDNAINP